jgi:hypothetical protein
MVAATPASATAVPIHGNALLTRFDNRRPPPPHELIASRH